MTGNGTVKKKVTTRVTLIGNLTNSISLAVRQVLLLGHNAIVPPKLFRRVESVSSVKHHVKGRRAVLKFISDCTNTQSLRVIFFSKSADRERKKVTAFSIKSESDRGIKFFLFLFFFSNKIQRGGNIKHTVAR